MIQKVVMKPKQCLLNGQGIFESYLYNYDEYF